MFLFAYLNSDEASRQYPKTTGYAVSHNQPIGQSLKAKTAWVMLKRRLVGFVTGHYCSDGLFFYAKVNGFNTLVITGYAGDGILAVMLQFLRQDTSMTEASYSSSTVTPEARRIARPRSAVPNYRFAIRSSRLPLVCSLSCYNSIAKTRSVR